MQVYRVLSVALTLLIGAASCNRGGCNRGDGCNWRGSRSKFSVTSPAGAAGPPGTVSVAALFDQIVSLDRLTRPDPTPYTWRQVSSTNLRTDPRDSRSWYGDDEGHVRVEGGQRVILESSQPGALVRFWTTNPAGRIRVYIDGSESPAIDEEVRKLVTGKTPHCTPPFTYVSAGGMNLIHPISWSKSVKITASSPKLFYVMDIREYDAKTVVEPYPGVPSQSLAFARHRAASILTSGYKELAPTASYALDSTDPASVAVLRASTDGSVVRTTRLRLSNTDGSKLSRTALQVDIDGNRVVEIPLSAALAPMSDAAPVASLPLSSSGNEWVLRLPMPFAREARVGLTDRGGGKVTGTLGVTVEPMQVTESTYRLFAAYVGPETSNVSTWPAQVNLASIRGSGRFIGLTYEVANDDPRRQWWGEGDPIVAVDGRGFRGTGTEDHFLLGFCSTDLFRSPFSGQTRANAGNHGGLITLYRFHTSDDIPFNSSFDLDFELLAWGTHHDRTIKLQTAAVSWFYGRLDTKFVGATGDRAPFTPISLPPSLVQPGNYSVTCGP